MSVETGWMNDVLNDLQSFCTKNGLDTVAQKLEETNKFINRELGHDGVELMSLKGSKDTSCL